MKEFSKYRSVLWLLPVYFLAACSDPSGSGSEQGSEAIVERTPQGPTVDQVRVARLTEAVINAIPTSEEVEALMDEMGKEYQMELLNPIEHVSKYQLVSDKAINLGIYLCDLGYISSFNQTQELIFYVNCSKKLSEGIGVNEVVDPQTLENLELHMDNQDSLQAIIHRIYNQTYAFLDQTDRLNTATLMITGGWIEGLYIAMQLIDLKDPHLEMIENLIKQQEVYDQLMELLGNFREDPAAEELYARLKDLGPAFKKINAEGEDQQEALAALKEKITALRNDCIAF